jgi:hypothetical protein
MANVLKMATVADIVTLIQAGSSERRISALLSLDRGTVAKYRRQLQLDESVRLFRPKNRSSPPEELIQWRVLVHRDFAFGGSKIV